MIRNKTIQFLGVFLISVLTMDLAIGWALNKMQADNLYGMTGGHVNYYMSTPTPDVLIVGSSRAHHNVMPEGFEEPAFNLSHNGMGVGYHVALMDVLASEGKLPNKRLLLQVEPRDFLGESETIGRDVQFLGQFYHSSNFVRQTINDLGRFEFTKYWFHSFPSNGKVTSILMNYYKTKRLGPPRTDGFEPVLPDANDSLYTVKSAAKVNVNKYDMRDIESKDIANSDGARFLTHLKKICEKAGVELVLFTAPYYRRGSDRDLAPLFEHYCHQEGFRYLNFSYNIVPGLDDPWLWRDNSHLNLKGAKVFTRVLVDQL